MNMSTLTALHCNEVGADPVDEVIINRANGCEILVTKEIKLPHLSAIYLTLSDLYVKQEQVITILLWKHVNHVEYL